MFCSNCGAEVGALVAAAESDQMTEAGAQVEIERLRTKRDIEVARINAGVARELSDADQAAELAHAEGERDGMEAVLDAVAGDPPAEGGDPIVIPAPADDAEPEPVADVLPPVAEPTEPTEPDSKPSGFWGAYS